MPAWPILWPILWPIFWPIFDAVDRVSDQWDRLQTAFQGFWQLIAWTGLILVRPAARPGRGIWRPEP